LGDEDAPFDPIAPAAPIRAIRRFAEPVGREEDVMAAVGALIAQAGETMAQRGIGGRRFALALHRSDGHVARLAIDTATPTRDPALVLRLLRERIASLADLLDPGFGYDAITLAVPRHDPLGAAQGALEEGPQTPKPLSALLDRLAVRHGAGQVLRMVAANSHVPERAAGMIAHGQSNRGQAAKAPDWITPAPDEPPSRPLLLLDPPQRLEVLAGLPDGPPRRFRWRGRDHRIVRAEGPERIAAE
jgi:protein ImuB